MLGRLPPWFKQECADPKVMLPIEGLLGRLNLNTICKSALCPNITNCFARKTATFLILGDVCTRHCTFCAVKKGRPLPVDDKEPQHLVEAVDKLNLNYVVITSTTRDDLSDGGVSHFIKTIRMLHRERPGACVEVLIPDFLGSSEAIKALVESQPEVINHNLETVPRLYPQVRPEADYSRSLNLLSAVKKLNPKIVTKSGLMLGLGEEADEVLEVMKDLRKANCDLLTLGQYLQPSPEHLPVARYVPPEEFHQLGVTAREMGFAEAASMPLVRSSFRAAELYRKAKNAKTTEQIMQNA